MNRAGRAARARWASRRRRPTVTRDPAGAQRGAAHRGEDRATCSSSTIQPAQMQVLVIGDACTDDTLERAQAAGGSARRDHRARRRARQGRRPQRRRSNARRGEILVFTDAAIMLERRIAARAWSAHFARSGDRLRLGRGLHRRRRQRRTVRPPRAAAAPRRGAAAFHRRRQRLFLRAAPRVDCRRSCSGMAPDFLSVLNVVRAGSRALAEPRGARRR